MDHVTIAPDALDGYAAATASVAATVAAAGSIDAAANTAAMIPVFGLIGQEFLAAFIGAQGNHLVAVGNLAAVHAGTAVAASAGAVAFRGTDHAAAAGLKGL